MRTCTHMHVSFLAHMHTCSDMQLRVYVVTAAWSIWAYIWMLIVYVYWTPNEVTLAEAFLTLGEMLILYVCATCTRYGSG